MLDPIVTETGAALPDPKRQGILDQIAGKIFVGVVAGLLAILVRSLATP